MSVRVEFAGGGPADGTKRELPRADSYVRIHQLRSEPKWWEDGAGPDGVAHSSTITHLYRQANRLSKDGYQIYEYAGIERSVQR